MLKYVNTQTKISEPCVMIWVSCARCFLVEYTSNIF